MSGQRPEIFISATSGDLRTCRQMVKEALLTLGCVPMEQTNFPPDARTVRDMLRVRIAGCHAVVHVAGEYFGAEPSERGPEDPRRSYTQMEYDLARELKKPVYVFICGEGFPYDPHEPEDPEKQELQRQHRVRLQAGDHLYYPVTSRDDLALRVQALQTRVELLGRELGKSHSRLAWGLGIGLGLLVLLGGGIWMLHQQQSATNNQVAQIKTELDQQRDYIKSVADSYTQLQAQQQGKMTDEERYNLALAEVAKKEKISPDELRKEINLFVTGVQANPKADFLDRALADFAQLHFKEAAVSAGQAADEARNQRLAAEQLASQAQQQAVQARDREREARILQGRSLDAAHQYGDAVTAFQQALEITARADQPQKWAEISLLMGNSLLQWAKNSEGEQIHQRRDEIGRAHV